jgi:hypothetical protein
MYLFKKFSEFKNNVALINENRQLKYKDLLTNAKKLKLIIKKKSLILIMMDNNI